MNKIGRKRGVAEESRVFVKMEKERDKNKETINYSVPSAELPYTGQHPNMAEFEKPWEVCIQVGQGKGEVSIDDKPLQSEGFSKCLALILQNALNKEAALFHIDELGLNPEQEEILKRLSSDGQFIARFVRGDLSRDVGKRILSDQLSSPNLKFKIIAGEDVIFNSGNLHWAVVYKPSEKTIYVDSKKLKKVLTFNT